MPVLKGWRYINTTRLNSIVQTFASEKQVESPLTFLQRVPVVDADDDDIHAVWSGQIFAADIITDDAEAVVYESGKLETFVNTVPNIKIGTNVTQGVIRRLRRIQQNRPERGDASFLTNWQARMATSVLRGVRQTMNILLAAMMLDSVVYDRLGIKITGSWGMPSDLKATSANLWSDATNATPIADILTMRNYARTTYGREYNRVTMSSAALNQAIATVEFRNRVSGLNQFAFAAGMLNVQQTSQMANILGTLLDMTIVIEDNTFQRRGVGGTKTVERYLPVNKVILDSSANDGNESVWRFANAIPEETVVAPLVAPDMGLDVQSGPVAYYEGNATLNPPNLTAWAVAKGWPVKEDTEANAVLTVA